MVMEKKPTSMQVRGGHPKLTFSEGVGEGRRVEDEKESTAKRDERTKDKNIRKQKKTERYMCMLASQMLLCGCVITGPVHLDGGASAKAGPLTHLRLMRIALNVLLGNVGAENHCLVQRTSQGSVVGGRSSVHHEQRVCRNGRHDSGGGGRGTSVMMTSAGCDGARERCTWIAWVGEHRFHNHTARPRLKGACEGRHGGIRQRCHAHVGEDDGGFILPSFAGLAAAVCGSPSTRVGTGGRDLSYRCAVNTGRELL